MSSPSSALLLTGSPRRKTKSTSESLGSYLLEGLSRRGIGAETIHIHRALHRPDGLSTILEAIRGCDLIVVSFPLYVDSLPAPLIKVFESVVDASTDRHWERPKRLAAIVNCGFPEAVHTRTALSICRQFALEAGIEWLGGLGLGGGEAIGGKALVDAGRMARNVRKSLDLSIEALVQGEAIPDEAQDLMSRQLVPSWLYRWVGDRGWRRAAKKWKVAGRLWDRPFE